jgi:hypothetical protein
MSERLNEYLRAMRQRQPWAATCAACPHQLHAGRCWGMTEPAPGRLVQCRCTHKTDAAQAQLEAVRLRGDDK